MSSGKDKLNDCVSSEIVESHPEPDVTWGKGGIDDWGWQAYREENDRHIAPAEVQT